MEEEKNFDILKNPESSNGSNDKDTKRNSHYVFVKIHIRSTKYNLHGIIFLKIHPTSNTLENVDAVVSPLNRFLESISLDSNWSEHKAYITNKKFVGEFDNSLTSDIINEINLLANSHSSYADFVENIVKSHQQGDNESIIEEFKPLFARITSDKGIHIGVRTEFISQQEIDSFDNSSQNRKEEGREVSSIHRDPFFDVDGTLLDCFPAVAPVNGIPIFNIKVGNEIMVKVSNNTVHGYKFNEIFNLVSHDGRVFSKNATVLRIKYDNEEYKILVQLEDKIFGKITETEQIKVKTPQIEEEFKEKKEENNFIWKALSILGFIALLIITGLAYIFFL